MNLSPWRRLRLKEWHYFSVVSERWFLGVAVAQLHYVANVFCYLVERETGIKTEYTRLLPGGAGVTMAPSSIRGDTVYRKGTDEIRFSWTGGGWRASLALPWLEGSFEVDRDEAVALVFPLAENRLAYTHKEAGNRARGRLATGSREILLDGAQATLDWTRSQANRYTVWNWLSVAATTREGVRVGLNLSAHIYEDKENYCWIDGKAWPLGPATFSTPADSDWSATGTGFDLHFTPLGERRENVQLGIIASTFVQKFGRLSGSLTVNGRHYDLRDAFGVMEDHRALW